MSWSRENAWPGMAGEEQQEVELALGERDLLAVARDAVAGDVDVQVLEAQLLLGAAVVVVRRSTASTRAISSAGENGLTT
jgi:hypothetical protein